MSATWQSVGTGAASANTDVVITAPTGIAVNDLLICHIGGNGVGNGDITSAPSGWTFNIAGNFHWKVAVTADTSASTYTFSFSSVQNAGGTISRFNQVNISAPINTANNNTVTSTSIDAGAITPNVANTTLFIMTMYLSASPLTPSFATSNTTPTYTTQYNVNPVSTVRQTAGTASYAPTTSTGSNTTAIGASTVLRSSVVAINSAIPVTIVLTIAGVSVGAPTATPAAAILMTIAGVIVGAPSVLARLGNGITNLVKHAASWTDTTKH